MKIQSNVKKPLFYGFSDSLNISDVFLLAKEEFLYRNFLITCLDSAKNWKDFPAWIAYLKDKDFQYSFLDKAVIITQDHKARLFLEGKTFYHFDEVYLFTKDIIPTQDPTRTYTSDGYEFEKKLPEDFLDYFLKSGSITYLSDGCGLNFVTFSENLAKKIMRKYNTQQ